MDLQKNDSRNEISENNNTKSKQLSSSNNDDQSDSENGVTSGEQKHHVGPVMGIFFKVWSLVKVTKIRNHQKLRRQNSDEPGQFQYISGAQFEEQNRQFNEMRRAGSQPPVRSSHYSGNLPPSNRLQVSGPGQPLALGSGTNSTSSGVSSTASCQSSCAGSSGQLIKRHPSAYSLRRNTSDLPVSGKRVAQAARPLTVNQSNQEQQPKKASWTSKIRRSATSVNQSELSSYVSKYKTNRRQQQQQSTIISATPPSDLPKNLTTKATSSPKRFLARQLYDQRARLSLDAAELVDSCSNNNPNNNHSSASASSQVGKIENHKNEDEDIDEDEGSNDIYSTPNDSIQSVPSTVPALLHSAGLNDTRQHQVAGQVAHHQALRSSEPQQQQHCNPIIKSFSTSNFNQLLKQQHPFVSSSEEPSSDSKFLPAEAAHQQQLHRSRQLANGSRFFISSSSSEDSTSAAPKMQSSTAASHLQTTSIPQQPRQNSNLVPSTSIPLGLAAASFEQQRHLVLQSGVHYHAPASCRPSSLVGLLAAGNTQNVLATSTLLSPLDLFSIGHQSTLNAARNQIVRRNRLLPNSISLYDCQQLQAVGSSGIIKEEEEQQQQQDGLNAEYKLAQALLESGSDLDAARDETGNTALMLAVLSDNQSALRCLIERGANPDKTNQNGQTALDLVSSRGATRGRLELIKILLGGGAELDRISPEQGNSRLLDRLIGQHQTASNDKLAFIECLLQEGAKLGSATWVAAQHKPEVQVRLLKKLCQDGYFLYKKSSIEAAVYRFEYALKRIAELEQQLAMTAHLHQRNGPSSFGQQQQGSVTNSSSFTQVIARQLKYQTYLGLSRCERKRKFYKRALEFAQLAILIDSTAYEGYYSKAHILKDIGEIDDALMAIYQTARLVDKSIESLEIELHELDQHQEALLFGAGPYGEPLEWQPIDWLESSRSEITGNIEYLKEAKRFIGKLKADIMEDKLGQKQQQQQQPPSSSCMMATVIN